MPMTFSKEYLLSIIEKYNKLENLGDQWNFVKDALENEQAEMLLSWLHRTANTDDVASKIWAIKWLLNFIEKIQTQYPSAIEKIKEGR